MALISLALPAIRTRIVLMLPCPWRRLLLKELRRSWDGEREGDDDTPVLVWKSPGFFVLGPRR